MTKSIVDWPTVSIISITYKDLIGLEATRESLETQDYRGKIEHIVIDGGSGAEVRRFLEKSGVDKWVSEPDGGRYHAMNKGIAMAQGDIYWFMNSGDVFGERTSISEAAASLDSPRTQWGHGLARLVGPAREFMGIFGIFPFDLFRFSLGGKQIPHQAAFFGADLVRSVGGYSTTSGLSADQHFMLKCAQLTRPIFVPSFLANFDASGVGTTRNPRESFSEMRQFVRSERLYAGSRLLKWYFRARLAEEMYVLRTRRARRRARIGASEV